MTETEPMTQDTPDAASEGEMPATEEQFKGSFDDFELPPSIHKGLKELGYKQPTKVQHAVFDTVTGGADVIVQSRTGSGKTTAFALPTISKLDDQLDAVQAIALCPTRELAVQVANEASRLARFTELTVTAIYGGASIRGQIDALEKGTHMVVGTPGRVLDLIRRGHLKLNKVQFAILDEADEMLSMGFWDEVTSVLDQLPKGRQTLLFSATLPPAIERAAKEYLKEPKRIDLSSDSINVSTIRHVIHVADDSIARPRNFLYVLEFHRPHNGIVFCNRRDETELVCRYLRRFGFRAEALNGDMPQSARERVLRKVKAGELDLMVATDVAARGIDISDLGFVFNYDLPEFDEVYVHRVGRTGRIGKKGTAASLVRGKYMTHLTSLQRDYEVPFEEIELPDEKEIVWMQAERIAQQLTEAADGVEIGQYRPVAEAMLERGDAKEIMAFLIREHFSQAKHRKESREERERDREERDGDRDDREERRPRGRDRDRDERRPRGRDRDRDERRPRRDRDERDDRDDREEEAEDGAQVNLYVTLGRNDDIDDLSALAKLMSDMSGVDMGHFTGEGDLRDSSSHVQVDTEVADEIIAGVHGKLRPGAEAAGEDAEDDDDDDDEGSDEDGGRRRRVSPEIVCEKAKPKRRRRRRPRR